MWLLVNHFISFITTFGLVIANLTATPTPTPPPPIPASTTCSEDLKIGYRVMEFAPERKMAIWYPTTDPEADYQYGSTIGHISENGSVNTCQHWPLVVYSHGYTGCGVQSLFFTETLSRSGYIVAAPDHADHGCSIADNKTQSHRDINSPGSWSDQTYIERRNDIEDVINYLASPGSQLVDAIDFTNIGLAGHSLGGYTVAGIANAWPTWKDDRIKAALLFSPYMAPYQSENSVSKISIPVMYQGAANDYTTNASLDGSKGAYAQTTSTKYFLVLAKGDHFDWINTMCQNNTNIKECLENNQTVQTINAYSIAFFDRYLKGISSQILESTASALQKYQYSP